MARPKPPEDPRELMNQALRLISRELDFLETVGESRKLESDEALSLVRYSDSLLKFVKDEEKQESDVKRKLSKMTTAELALEAAELAAAAKAKQPK